MRKKTKVYIAFCVIIILATIIVTKEEKEVVSVPATSTPTPAPTETPTPTPTISPTPTPTPTPSPSPTVTPTPIMSATHTVNQAIKVAERQLELCSVEKPTLYNTYSEEELELLFRVVEAEATDYSIECKSHVASVIFNRLKEGWWGGDLTRSIMAKRQFEVITNGRYKRVKVTEETILACEIAFEQDTAQGALFFDSTKGKSWAHKNRTYIFSDDAHWFYK